MWSETPHSRFLLPPDNFFSWKIQINTTILKDTCNFS